MWKTFFFTLVQLLKKCKCRFPVPGTSDVIRCAASIASLRVSIFPAGLPLIELLSWRFLLVENVLRWWIIQQNIIFIWCRVSEVNLGCVYYLFELNKNFSSQMHAFLVQAFDCYGSTLWQIKSKKEIVKYRQDLAKLQKTMFSTQVAKLRRQSHTCALQ